MARIVTDFSFLKIERLGGLAGIGLPGSRIRSQGQVDPSTLPPHDQKTVESLFADNHRSTPDVTDGFRYRLTRKTSGGDQSVEVPEHLMPPILVSAVKDELI